MTSPTLERISELGLAQLWQVTVLAMVVGLIVRLGCRHRPHLAYLLWMLVLVKCLVPPLAASRLSPFSWLLAQRVEQAAGRAVIPATIALAANDPVTGTTTGDAAIAAAMPAAVAAPSIDLVALASAIVLALWAAGATALALLVVAKHVKLRRAIRQASAPPPRLTQQLELLAQRLGVRRPPALVVTDEPLGPLVCGLLRPTIVLPATALQTAGEQAEDAIDLESVLAHELVHVRRGDTIVSLLQTVAQAVWWFHPLVWWANRELRRQRERSCDEEVIAGLGCRPTRYARSLLAVLEVRPRPSKSWALAGVPMLSFTAQRLAHLVREQATFRRRTPRGYWAIAIALVVVLIPGAGLSLEAPPNENAKKDPPEKPATWTTASGDVTTLEITGTLVAGDAVLADEGDDAQITGHFIAAPQTPVPAGEIGSDAQRAAVAELEKLGGAVYAARDKAGQIHMTVILERDKWKGGSAGLAQLKALEDLSGLYIGCRSLPGDGLAPLKELTQLNSLQLDHPSTEQLATLAGWQSLTNLTVIGDDMSDAGLGAVAQLPNIEALTIAGDGPKEQPPQVTITDAGIASLNGLRRLKTLTISNCPRVLGSTLGELASAVDLRMVVLMQNGFDDRGMAELPKLSQVKRLMLDVSNVSSAGCAPLGKLTSLERLSLTEARSFDDAAAAHLASLKNLRALHLFDNRLTDAGLAPLAGLTELRELQLWRGQYSDAGIAHLKGMNKLRVLRIDSDQLDVGDAAFGNLAAMTELRQLSLQARRTTDAGLAALAGLTQLQVLELQHTQVRGSGLANLKSMSKLQNLFLDDTLVDDAGLQSLPALPKLSLLSLGSTKLTDAGLATLAELPNLTRLTLSDTSITDAGVAMLVKLPKLQTLDLSNTKITDAGLEQFADAKELRALFVPGTAVTDEGKKAFRERHPEIAFQPEWAFSLSFNTFITSDESEEDSSVEKTSEAVDKPDEQ